MATARDIINQALVNIRVKANGQTLAMSHLSDGLDALNDLIDSWAGENLTIYQEKEESFSLTSGQASYSIGENGTPDFDTARPIELVSGWYVRDSGGATDYPVEVVSLEQYRMRRSKGLTGRPFQVSYNPTYPNGTLYFYYTPDDGRVVYMRSLKPVPTFTSINSTVSLPVGYKRALIKNLAIELAEGYGKTVTQTLYTAAKEAKNNIKRNNAQRIETKMLEVSVLSS